jgi:Holliday junction DNA helicase RuvA
MIGSLRGSLLHRSDNGVLVVEVGGVGYRVTVTGRSAAMSARLGSTVFLWVHTHVKEDVLALYGFDTASELECFEALLGAHGVGPSLAMAVLGCLTPDSLRGAVAAGDVDRLIAVPGVGRKTAQRLLIDLASSLGVDPADGGALRRTVAPVVAEVREALCGLGYGPEEVKSVLSALPDLDDTASLLKAALKELARS